jgi:serine protease Do
MWIAFAFGLLIVIGDVPLPAQQYQNVASQIFTAPADEAKNVELLSEKLKPAVVNLSKVSKVYTGERVLESRGSNLGSGFIIDKDGYIFTNNHIVASSTEIKVLVSDYGKFHARVVGRDSKTDLALLKIETTQNLPVVPLGDSDRLQVNERVIAISTTSLGTGHRVMPGSVIARGPLIGAGPYDDFIQTDTIGSGDGNGPLFNMNGEVIGIITAILPGKKKDIGIAIPINVAKEILPQLREKGRVVRGSIGLVLQRVTPEIAKAFELECENGALVADVVLGGPGERAGILRGDVVVEFDKNLIRRPDDLVRLLHITPPGSAVTLKVIRERTERTVYLTVSELKEP